jgi:hypothetical protein
MKARDLAASILALPQAQQELEVVAMEEIWAYAVSEPRLTYLDGEGKEADTGEAVIALWAKH